MSSHAIPSFVRNQVLLQPHAIGTVGYRAIGGPNGLLAGHLPFVGNTMSMTKLESGMVIVYSYNRIIAFTTSVTVGDDTTINLIIDPDNLYGYSHTTSRHINTCRSWLRSKPYGNATVNTTNGYTNIYPVED